MKLRLFNFKCYESEEFDIPDTGLVLISAPSGSGKSTILDAILFVLFGVGKKLPSWGKKSCKVEMEYTPRETHPNGFGSKGIMYIVRTKVPNRLFLKLNTKETYEDAAAQEIINREFGETFQTTSFVDQYNLYKSFILMSPSDKIAFLEKFAFHDVDLVDIKEKSKDKIKKAGQELSKVQNQLETSQEILKTYSVPELIKFPLKRSKNLTEEKLIKNENIRYKNTKTKIARTERSIKQSEINLKKIEVYHTRKDKLTEDITNLTKEITTLSKKQNELDCMNDDEIASLEKKLTNLINSRESINLDKSIEELRETLKNSEKQERDELINKIKNIKKITTQNPHEIENLLAILYQQKGKAVDHDKFSKEIKEYDDVSEEDLLQLKDELKRNLDLLEKGKEELNKIKLSLANLTCPSCGITLLLQHDPLTLISSSGIATSGRDKEEVEKELEEIKKNIEYLQKTVIEDSKKLEKKNVLQNKLDTVKKFFEGYGIQKSNLKQIEEAIQRNNSSFTTLNKNLDILQDMESRLRNDHLSSAIMNMRKDLAKKNKEREAIGEKENCNETSGNEKELRDTLLNQKMICKEYDMLQEQIENLEDKLTKKKEELDKIKITESWTPENIKSEIKEATKELTQLKIKLSEHEKISKELEKYEKYINEKDRYEILNQKVQNLIREEMEAQSFLNASELFRQKVLESESVSIRSVIDSINIFASEYLDMFFPDEQINVKLLPFKEAKNKKSEKPQINLQIVYKNEDCDISSLSGGELSRVVLAFTLALGEIFNTPMILLDECTAGLDSENTQNVFESIRKSFGNRLVLTIGHQMTHGAYDNVIML